MSRQDGCAFLLYYTINLTFKPGKIKERNLIFLVSNSISVVKNIKLSANTVLIKIQNIHINIIFFTNITNINCICDDVVRYQSLAWNLLSLIAVAVAQMIISARSNKDELKKYSEVPLTPLVSSSLNVLSVFNLAQLSKLLCRGNFRVMAFPDSLGRPIQYVPPR